MGWMDLADWSVCGLETELPVERFGNYKKNFCKI